MKTDLKILIDEFQKEIDFLEKQMNSCVEMMDFKGAQGYKKSLIYTKEKLQVLKNLENCHFDEINRLNRTIEYIKNKRHKYKNNELFWNGFIQKQKEFEERISKLERQSKNKFNLDSEELVNCLEKIVISELSQFKIVFKKTELSIRLQKEDASLKIELNRKENRLYLRLADKSILKNMGFELQEHLAIKYIPSFQKSDIESTIEILARITFEVFRVYGNEEAIISLDD